MSQEQVTVLGGTGFLGQRVIRKLADAGFRVRVAARNPAAVAFPEIESGLERSSVDIRSEQDVATAVEGAKAVVNAVALYVEREGLDFNAVHVEGAARVARLSKAAGAEALVHVSGIGASADSESKLVRCKAEGEQVVNEQFPAATVVRPSVMFGQGDAFLAGIEAATRPPVVPLFGSGEMRLRPAWVQDVAFGIVHAIGNGEARGKTFELGGSRILSYREAVEAVCDALGRRRLLVPFPLALWRVLIGAMQILPSPPLTIDQLHLLAKDNTVSPDCASFADLGIEPCSMLDMLERFLEE